MRVALLMHVFLRNMQIRPDYDQRHSWQLAHPDLCTSLTIPQTRPSGNPMSIP